MPFIEALGQQMAGNAGGGLLNQGMGLLFAGPNRNAQMKTATRMQDLQIKGSKELTDYNTSKQLQMWKDTGYVGQMEQMKLAGLNPALMYGMGGGGGQTASIAQGSVGGQSAGTPQAAAMGIQLGQYELLQAQIRNIDADTANKQAENPNIPKAGQKLDAEIQSILQGITNQKTINEINEFQKRISKVDANVAEQTEPYKMEYIVALAEQGSAAVEAIQRDNSIAEATRNDKTNQIRAEALGAVLRNELTRAQTGKTNAEISQVATTIAKMINDMALDWAKLTNEQKKTALQEKLVNFQTAQSQRTYDNILRGIQTVLGAIKPSTVVNQGPRETTIYNQ